MSRYRVFAHSTRGAKYEAKGWECQDYSHCYPTFVSATSNFQLIAIADGHGGKNYFRSQRGAMFATDVVRSQALRFCKELFSQDKESQYFSETGIQNFKYAVCEFWREVIKTDWDEFRADTQHFVEDIRFKDVQEQYKERYTSQDPEEQERYFYTAYGTTLSFALAISTQILLTQIGDGTCVVLYRNGEFDTPVPAEAENFLNVTVSLCEPDAPKKMRHVVINRNPGTLREPVAVFLSSDGVDDCYEIHENEKHLYRLYTLILENIINAGVEQTEDEIRKDLLPKMASKSGSGDDCSMAWLLCDDMDVLRETYENISAEFKPKPGEGTSS